MARDRARRAGFNPSRGYVGISSGDVVQDPDERRREAIRLVFDVFERRRSIHGIVRYLADHDVSLPDRCRTGQTRGEARWRGIGRTARR